MPEALARGYDDDYLDDAQPKRRARSRTARIEPSVSHVPQMRNGKSAADAPALVRVLRAMIHRPLRTLVTLACGAIVVSFISNLLFMQDGPHPAPLFAKQDAKPAEQGARPAQPVSAQRSEPAPRIIAFPPPAQMTDAAPPMPSSAPRSAPVSIMPAPPARLAEQPRPAAKQPDFDPIAQFLRSGVSQAPTTTASTNAPSTAEIKRVAAAQRALSKLGQNLDADGLMGPGTRAAIQKFERDNKLPVTGELGPRTVKALSARASIPIP
ncbi:MAG: peptidoglycan-binding protein [Beijerinckiaceae bacterium]|nr:peptidoglycan-binding protein [Beijerinckiaceae bacterium]